MRVTALALVASGCLGSVSAQLVEPVDQMPDPSSYRVYAHPGVDHAGVTVVTPSLVSVRWVKDTGEEVFRAGVATRSGEVVTRFLRKPARAVAVRDSEGREHEVSGVVFLTSDQEGCRLGVSWSGEPPRGATILRNPNYSSGEELIAIGAKSSREDAPWRLFVGYRGRVADDRQDFAARVPWRINLLDAAESVIVDGRGAVIGFVSGWTRTGTEGGMSETRVNVIEARRFVSGAATGGSEPAAPLSWDEVAELREMRKRAGDLAAKARAALRFENLGDASELAREAVTIDPHYPFTLVIYGDVLLAEEAYSEAAEVLEKASELAPAHVDARIKACFAHHKVGSAESLRAISRLARELEVLAPEHPETHWYLAVRALRAGNGELAAIHLQRAAELRPDAVHYQDQLARFSGD